MKVSFSSIDSLAGSPARFLLGLLRCFAFLALSEDVRLRLVPTILPQLYGSKVISDIG